MWIFKELIVMFLVQRTLSQSITPLSSNSIYIIPKYFHSTLPSKVPLTTPILQISSEQTKIPIYTNYPLKLNNNTLSDFIPQASQYNYYPSQNPATYNRHPYSEQIKQSNYYLPSHLQSQNHRYNHEPLIYYKPNIPHSSPVQYKTVHSYTPVYPTKSSQKTIPTIKPYNQHYQQPKNNFPTQYYNPFNPLTVPPVYVKNPPIPVPQYQPYRPVSKDHEETRNNDEKDEEDEELNEEEEEEEEEEVEERPQKYSNNRDKYRNKNQNSDFRPYFRYRNEEDEDDETEELNENEDEDEAESKLKKEIVHLIQTSEPIRSKKLGVQPNESQRQVQLFQQKWLVKTTR